MNARNDSTGADGTDCLSLGTFQEEEFTRHWPLLLALLSQAPHKLSRKDMLNRWPSGNVPDKGSLGRCLEIGVDSLGARPYHIPTMLYNEFFHNSYASLGC